ncbi:MAG: 30S ribosomal protein S9 [Candidatus Bathyarchaeota archaeon]|jgi:small subunit ribosomal protein S9
MVTKKVLIVSGKRKTAVARAVVKPGVGRVRVNRIPIEIYEPEVVREKIMEPLLQAGDEIWQELDINVKVTGGGYMSQAEASRMAIANALLEWTKSSRLHKIFIEYDRTMVVGDPRRKEPKKFGGPGARARSQKSYR